MGIGYLSYHLCGDGVGQSIYELLLEHDRLPKGVEFFATARFIWSQRVGSPVGAPVGGRNFSAVLPSLSYIQTLLAINSLLGECGVRSVVNCRVAGTPST